MGYRYCAWEMTWSCDPTINNRIVLPSDPASEHDGTTPVYAQRRDTKSAPKLFIYAS